jgi:hypothetical protein
MRRLCSERTFGQFFNTDIIELFYLFHDKLLFIDLDNQRGTPGTPSCKTEFPKGIFDCLGDIDGLRLNQYKSQLWVKFRKIYLTIDRVLCM